MVLLGRGELALVQSKDDGRLGQVVLMTLVARPPEQVHAVVADPALYPEFMPSVERVGLVALLVEGMGGEQAGLARADDGDLPHRRLAAYSPKRYVRLSPHSRGRPRFAETRPCVSPLAKPDVIYLSSVRFLPNRLNSQLSRALTYTMLASTRL